MCHKNVLEYLFYCFFQKDDFFMFSLYELIKQCIKHIFTHVEDKYLLYCIFVKNILITDSFCMKTFYIKKFIELFYKSDNNYLYFIINKEYYRLKTYFDKHKESQIIKNRPVYCSRHSDINVDNFICVNNMMEGRKELINEQYFQYLRNQLLEIHKSEEIWYNHITYKKEENIFFNYKIVKMEIEKYGGRNTCELEEMKVEKYYLYNFHCIEKIIYLELYTLCTLRKYEHIEIVNYKNDYFYQLCGDFLLNVKTLKNFLYFSNDEVILSILSFICENKYLNICDLYLFLTFLTTSITNITRTNRDLKKQNLECLNKSFIPLMKSHRQVDHSFSAFLLKLCYISINCNSNITEKNKMNLLNNTNTNGSSSNNMTFINVHSLKLFVKEDVLSCNFFNHLNKFSDIGNNIRGNNTYLTNYINYLLSDNCKYNMSRNIYLYILENFINKIKKESIVKLTRHKDIENSEMITSISIRR
ncbi:conserved Plasmodium protein, unknown function [Plasmodium malariae]|uniref:Uncharacterized protein n=1 Tax=Plasmodium malariae TaxID=5858 RepID=A0A1C3L2E8_PLAMA|nr:conserved Plasmodium protein, unknown function [Plasmodium malariae]